MAALLGAAAAAQDISSQDVLDGLKNPIRVYAVGNPEATYRPGRLASLHDKASGYGIVRFDRKGRTMTLVGRADPRGESEYNLALGGHRANSVKSAPISAQLDEKWITTTSRGELDARGTDEASWQHDRRVDVLLVN